MPNIEILSASKIEALHEKRDAAHYAVVKEFCDQGRGHLRHSDILELAGIDDTARRYVETWDALLTVRLELASRKRWHGTHKPIRRKESA